MNDVKIAYAADVIELFELQVYQTPQHLAISEPSQSYTYAALNDKANQFAHCLKQHKIQSGAYVGVLLTPGVDFVASILAIVKLGAVYLPLDTLAPPRRLVELLEDARPQLVISNEHYQPLIYQEGREVLLVEDLNLESINYPRSNLNTLISPDSPLYMMYTSGSTGRPKGVIIPHQAVVNLVVTQNDFQLQAGEVIAQFNNLAFDASPFELWSALLHGANLAVVPHEIRTDFAQLKNFLADNQVSYLCLPTGFFHQIIKSSPETLDGIKRIIFGGEQVNAGLLKHFLTYRKVQKYPIELINGYGPTETVAYTCRQKLTEQSGLQDELLSSIGRPIEQAKLYVLDENKRRVEEGELYISGINLALGYHNSDCQQQGQFIMNPFEQRAPFQRLYKTGDRVRLLASGDYLFLGRFDDQVKIGGFRIHLNEIEQHLMHYPAISLAAVKVELGSASHKILSAYIVLSTPQKTVSADEIRQFLSEIVPSYMLPAKYLLVDELPLTLAGKVDKNKLDSLPYTNLAIPQEDSASSAIEEQIKKIWQGLLNGAVLDSNKNLFEMGANSLLIAEACVQINKVLQSELHVADLLTHPTIYKLSCYLEGRVETPARKTIKAVESQDVAIIGMACRLPGACSVQEYWENLCQGKESLERFDAESLDEEAQFVPVRGTLADIDKFDAHFFGFNPGDAHIADPQQRFFLECAWEALEHAAIAPTQLKTKIISVFAGMSDSTYLPENLLKNSWFTQEHDLLQQRIACSTSMLSTQISYRLNLKGRSLNVNTACSTGLTTVEQACQDLVLGHSDIALAGAASIVVPQKKGYLYQAGSILSPDGHCRPFAEAANGTVFSDGVGVVILKRLADAVADGDTVYAVIQGRGVNNDGSDKLGFAAPSTSGQQSCIREALSQAQIKAEEVGYLEAHGTATALGDVVEINALTAAFREHTAKKQFCFLGSVKGNIGHTEVTAGLAGLIKTALCLYHRKIPPMAHSGKQNPDLLLHESPFVINSHLVDWTSNAKKRYAGVSSFGIGGTNIHMVLREHLQEPQAQGLDQEQLIILSAKTEYSLEQQTQNMLHYLSTQSATFADAAYTLQTGREAFQRRRFGVGKTVAEAAKNLTQNPMNTCNDSLQKKLVFMFPGQGAQYQMMAMELMEKVPFFAALVERGMALAQQYLGEDLLVIIRNPEDARLQQTQYAQPALFIIEYALAQLLIYYGIKPDKLIGHSLGEYVAACVAGVMSFDDAIMLVCGRGLLMAGAELGAMLAIECSKAEFLAYQKIIPVELALHNAPNHCVASGSVVEIALLEQHLAALDKAYQKLKVSHAFHSRFMDAVEKPFKELLSTIALSAPLIPIISNLTGTWLSAADATSPDYWYRHLRHTVRLCDGLQALTADRHAFFIEVGPGLGLNTFLKAQHKVVLGTHILPNHTRQTGDYQQLLSALGRLWQNGVRINWQYLHGDEKKQRIALPTYAFQRQRYWIEPDSSAHVNKGMTPLYQLVWSHQPAYLELLPLEVNQLAQHSWIIFNDHQGLAASWAHFLLQRGIQPILIEAGTEYRATTPFSFVINLAEKAHYAAVWQQIKTQLHEPIILHLSSCSVAPEGLLAAHEINQQLAASFHSLIYLTQAYLEQIGEQIPLQCAVITTGTQQVLGTELMIPVNASLVGPCRVIMQEHQHLQYRLLDVSLAELAFYNERLISYVLHSCLHETWDPHHPISAYRNGYRWDVRSAPLKAAEKRMRFKDKGVYLITGGLGGMALSLCEVIAKTVAQPKFILLSRTAHPADESVAPLKKLQDLGATFFLHQTDVTQLDALCATVNYYKDHLGTIDGVIHSAGIPGRGLVQLKCKEKADAVLLPKLHGTYNLAKALQGLSLDFVALMSSLAAVVGGKGQVDYCAANACLDAFATTRLFPTQFIVSLNWNSWRDVGMTVATRCVDNLNYFDRGNNISPKQGQQLFLQIMEQNGANAMISNYDLEWYGRMRLQTNDRPALSIIKQTRHERNVVAPYHAPKNSVEEKLAHLWQNNLGIDRVSVQDDFFSLGGHSLKALGLIAKINKTFDAELSIQDLYKAPTIVQLSELLRSTIDS